MANFWGYADSFTDRPDVWRTDGYVTITDGYGTPSLTTVPSGIVKSIARTGTGAYTLTLSQPPAALVSAHIQSMIPSGKSPGTVGTQLLSTNIGASGVVNPVLNFQFQVTGTATELPSGSAFLYSLAVTVT